MGAVVPHLDRGRDRSVRTRGQVGGAAMSNQLMEIIVFSAFTLFLLTASGVAVMMAWSIWKDR